MVFFRDLRVSFVTFVFRFCDRIIAVKIGFVSLGCPKNLVDSEVMLGLAEQAGHEITTDAEGADVLVVNTCAFIDRAKQESIDTILEMAELKKQSPGRRLVVTGCLAERYRDELRREIPEIDAVLGTGEVTGLVGALSGVGSHGRELARPSAGSGRTSTGPSAQPRARAIGATPDARQRPPEQRSEGRPDSPTPTPAPGHAPVFGLDLPTYLYDADTPGGAPHPATTPT